jgi:hypothetical protein
VLPHDKVKKDGFKLEQVLNHQKNNNNNNKGAELFTFEGHVSPF